VPRQPNIIRSTSLDLAIPEDLRIKLDLELFSEVEGRVPKGAYKNFICGLLTDYFRQKETDRAIANQEG
jgi:hypothetical protein